MKINVVVGFKICEIEDCKSKDDYIEDLEKSNIDLTDKCDQFLMIHDHNTKIFKKLYKLYIEQLEEIRKLKSE